MAWHLDARIPVTLLADPAALPAALGTGRPAALLAEGEPPSVPGIIAADAFRPVVRHPAACACCSGRSAAALALDRLFQARVHGRAGWFERVLVLTASAQGHAEVTDALARDVLTAARFRTTSPAG